jgi:hypothetical protein
MPRNKRMPPAWDKKRSRWQRDCLRLEPALRCVTVTELDAFLCVFVCMLLTLRMIDVDAGKNCSPIERNAIDKS